MEHEGKLYDEVETVKVKYLLDGLSNCCGCQAAVTATARYGCSYGMCWVIAGKEASSKYDRGWL